MNTIKNVGVSMFGHDDTKDEDNKDTGSATINPTFDLEGQTPSPAATAAPSDDSPTVDTSNSFSPTDTTDEPSITEGSSDEPSGTPPISDVSAPSPAGDTATPPAAMDTPSAPSDEPSTPTAIPENDKLIDLKKKSLEELSPLLGHLDQTPEEKYKTTMMMIQATDDSSLIQTAHDAALEISDEKVRAQALLDIVNEINYFTHVTSGDDSASDK